LGVITRDSLAVVVVVEAVDDRRSLGLGEVKVAAMKPGMSA
jgi:hypothetical protein